MEIKVGIKSETLEEMEKFAVKNAQLTAAELLTTKKYFNLGYYFFKFCPFSPIKWTLGVCVQNIFLWTTNQNAWEPGDFYFCWFPVIFFFTPFNLEITVGG